MQTGRQVNGQVGSLPSGQADQSVIWQICSYADGLAIILPGMRATIARRVHGLPDKRSAANPIRPPVPLSG